MLFGEIKSGKVWLGLLAYLLPNNFAQHVTGSLNFSDSFSIAAYWKHTFHVVLTIFISIRAPINESNIFVFGFSILCGNVLPIGAQQHCSPSITQVVFYCFELEADMCFEWKNQKSNSANRQSIPTYAIGTEERKFNFVYHKWKEKKKRWKQRPMPNCCELFQWTRKLLRQICSIHLACATHATVSMKNSHVADSSLLTVKLGRKLSDRTLYLVRCELEHSNYAAENANATESITMEPNPDIRATQLISLEFVGRYGRRKNDINFLVEKMGIVPCITNSAHENDAIDSQNRN